MTPQPVGPALRWTRAALVTAVALLFGVTAHVGADGLLPGPAALALLALVILGVSGRLLGRPASTVRVVLLLVSGQAFVHVFLTLTAGHAGEHREPAGQATRGTPPPPEPLTSSFPGSGQSLQDQLYANRPAAPPAELTIPEPVRHLVSDLVGEHAWMALAHLLAAAGVGLWLAYGERLLWTLLALASEGWRLVRQHVVAALAAGRTSVAASLLLHRALQHERLAAVAHLELTLDPEEPALSPRLARRGPPLVLAA